MQTERHPRVLYLGDTSLSTAAAYLAGILHNAGIPFDYVASDQALPLGALKEDYALIIISDYPAKRFRIGQLEEVSSLVRSGTGLLMIGGWESFSGMEADYQRTPLSEVLPVILADEDDRVNSANPCLVKLVSDHAIVDGLPFETNVPGIGGYNRFQAKPSASVILESQRVEVILRGGEFKFTLSQHTDPLLVLGKHGAGRVAAFASDVAPHWVGGFVDWGEARVSAQADGAGDVEVGNWYAEFFTRLVCWAGKL